MEEPRTAALRETLEEAGLGEGQLTVHWDIRQELRWGSRYRSSVQISVTVFCCRYERRGRPKVVTYWLARLRNYDDPVTLSDEHQGYRCHVIILCHVLSYHHVMLCHVFMSSWCRWARLEEAERLAPRHQAVLRGMSEALTRI